MEIVWCDEAGSLSSSLTETDATNNFTGLEIEDWLAGENSAARCKRIEKTWQNQNVRDGCNYIL
jgi:hypothetical protein